MLFHVYMSLAGKNVVIEFFSRKPSGAIVTEQQHEKPFIARYFTVPLAMTL